MAERQSWDDNGYFIRRGFVDQSVVSAMLDEIVDLCRRAAAGEDVSPALVMPEARIKAEASPDVTASRPEAFVSKVFRLHRYGVFAEFAHRNDVLDLVAGMLGDDLDVFLSQFIFKVPGAYGQPWHQDSFYFRFTPDHHQVGVWLAVTEATLENGCLWILPGSHTEPVHRHVPDARPESQFAYVEIVDHDMSGAESVLMQPGDLLVFDSHLMHRSTDNESDGIRAAMVYHYSPAGTVDRTPRERSVNDWVPARRVDRYDRPAASATGGAAEGVR